MQDIERFRGESPIDELHKSINETLAIAIDTFGREPEDINAKILIELLSIAKQSLNDELAITTLLREISKLQHSVIYALPALNNQQDYYD